MAKSIEKSVGRGGVNRPADLAVVRSLLALWAQEQGLPAMGSGAADQATIDAIVRFQGQVLHRPSPDGRVDPGGGTFAALLRLRAEQLARPSPGTAKVRYGPGVDPAARLVSAYSMAVIEKALAHAHMDAAVITSTLRPPGEQAAAMYKNAVKNLAAQLALYGPAGDAVLEVYRQNKAKEADKVIALMAEKIERLLEDGRRVSLHVVSPQAYAALNVIDVGVGSTQAAAGASFKQAELTKAFAKLVSEGYIAKFIDETAKTNRCWHLEIAPGAKEL